MFQKQHTHKRTVDLVRRNDKTDTMQIKIEIKSNHTVDPQEISIAESHMSEITHKLWGYCEAQKK